MSNWTGQDWASAAAVVSAIIASLAAGISFWQAQMFREQVVEDANLKKIQTTIEMNPHYSEEYITSSKFLFSELTDAIKKGNISDDEWKLISENIELMAAIS